MGRHENDDISHLNISHNTVDTTSYNDEGETALRDDLICAIKTFNHETKTIKYRVLAAGGQLFNPRLKDAHYIRRNNWQLSRVNSKVFNYYIDFLKYKRQALLRHAEREI